MPASKEDEEDEDIYEDDGEGEDELQSEAPSSEKPVDISNLDSILRCAGGVQICVLDCRRSDQRQQRSPLPSPLSSLLPAPSRTLESLRTFRIPKADEADLIAAATAAQAIGRCVKGFVSALALSTAFLCGLVPFSLGV